MSSDYIYIIGGSGFLGSRLAKIFTEHNIKYNSCDIDTSSDKTIFIDVEDTNSLNELANADVIINLAALHSDDVKPLSRYDDVNVQGAVNVCNAARKHAIKKIIFTSSVAIYGFAPPNTGENGNPEYFNDYGRTKFLAENIYKKWQSEDQENRTLVIIRPTVIFGEGNRGNVFNLLNQINNRNFVMVGDGKNFKSMAYVENVASFIKYTLDFETGTHIHNYIDKPDLSMNELVKVSRKTLFNKENIPIRIPVFIGVFIGLVADFFSKISNINLPVSLIRVKKFIKTTQFSSSAFDKGFIAPVSLEEGLAKTLKYEFLEDNSDKATFKTE